MNKRDWEIFRKWENLCANYDYVAPWVLLNIRREIEAYEKQKKGGVGFRDTHDGSAHGKRGVS